MAQTSWPFENIDTTETQFSQWARNINEGIKQGTGSELAVTAPGGAMTVQVASGQAMIRGHYYSNTATETLNIAAANPSNPRIDSVVLELDPSANTVILKVLTGTPAGSPVAPSLTQTESGIYQLRLANVAIAAGALSISSGNITDLRQYMYAGVGKWTTAARPTNPVQNETVGFNTTLNQHEYWNGSAWVPFTPADSVRDTDYSTTGDILYASAANTPTRLPIGANNTVLKSNGTTIEWGSNPTPLSAFTFSGVETLPNEAGHYSVARRFSTGGSIWVNGVNSYSSTSATGATGLDTGNGFQDLSANAVVEFYPAWGVASFGSTHNLNSITTFSSNFYVATNRTAGVTNIDPVSVSTNGSTWTRVPTVFLGAAGSPVSALCHAFGNGVYVVAGQSGNILTSTNRTTWTSRTSGTANNIQGLTFANNSFVGAAGTQVVYSTNATTWSVFTTTGVQSEHAPAYGTQGWVVAQTLNLYATSPDGTSWTTRTNAIGTSSVYAATWGNGVYLLGGNAGALISSTNSTVWTARTSGFGTSSIFGLAFGAGAYVAVGDGGTIRSSTDGITWTARTSGFTNTIHNVTFANNLFIAHAGGNRIATSTNGTTWTVVINNYSQNSQFGSHTVAWDGTRYLATGQGTTASAEPPIRFSTNLTTWEHVGVFDRDQNQQHVSGANGVLIVGGVNGRWQTSTDGALFTKYGWGFGTNQYVYTSMYATNTGFVVGGGDGTNAPIFAVSTDNITWNTTVSSAFPVGGYIFGLASNGTIAIAAGQTSGNSAVLTNSTNGTTWGSVTAPTSQALYGAAFGNGVLAIVTQSGTIFTSTDSITWTNRGSSGTGSVSPDGLHFINGQFVTHGTSGSTTGFGFSLSTDGITWRGRAIGVNLQPRGVVHTGTAYLGIGNNGASANAGALINETTGGTATLYLTNYGTPTVL